MSLASTNPRLATAKELAQEHIDESEVFRGKVTVTVLGESFRVGPERSRGMVERMRRELQRLIEESRRQ
jgi:hypothetical protein